MYRYECDKSLIHPWITREVRSDIPLTLMESYNKSDLILKFRRVS